MKLYKSMIMLIFDTFPYAIKWRDGRVNLNLEIQKYRKAEIQKIQKYKDKNYNCIISALLVKAPNWVLKSTKSGPK